MMDLVGGYPYWLIKNGLPFDYPKLERDEETEVIISGGGISGALSAYFLTEEGVNCVLIDSRTIGLGSTCASTALLQYELDSSLFELSARVGEPIAKRAYQLSSDAIDKLIRIMDKIKFREYEKTGSLYIAAKKNDVGMLTKEFAVRKENGFQVEWMNEENIKQHYGISAPAGIMSAQGASVNVYSLTHALLQHAIKKGLRIYDRTAFQEIRYAGKGIEIETANGKILHAKLLVNATGYEAVNLIGKKIATLHSTYAIAGEQMSAEKISQDKFPIIWNTDDPYFYMRLTADHRILAGGRDESFKNARVRDLMIDKKTKLLTDDVRKLFPGIDFIPEFSWTGTFAITKDSMPYIGMYNKFPNTFFALGFGGNGITFSVVAAEFLVDMIKGRKNEDAKIFSFER
jgi:glycine/D-amino acid oxidase-like deaminating enzyme